MAYKNVNTRKTKRVLAADDHELKTINPSNLQLINEFLAYMKGT